jgi:actin-like ATPase involved in cell morphogenesis
MSLFKRIPVYIKISTNQIEVTNLDSGKTLVERAAEPFSSQRMVLAKFNEAELLVRKLVKELISNRSWFPPQLKVIVQQMEKLEGGLAEIEKRAMRDLAEQAGASIVIIVDHDRKLSDQEALLELGNA